MSLRNTAYAFAASTLLACVPTRRECAFGDVEEVPGACYTKDGEIWLNGAIVSLEAGSDAEVEDADAGGSDTGEGTDATGADTGMAGEAGLDGGMGEGDGGKPDGGDAAGADAGCMNDFECSQLSTTPYCHLESHSCVGCIPGGLERTQCINGRACNPDTFTCTGAPRGSLYWCMPCISDTECSEDQNGTYRCVPLTFRGAALGTYCLRVAPANAACPNQTSIVKRATSVLEVEDDYCFPDEQRATCEAIDDFRNLCTRDDQCGADDLDDGLCTAISPGAKACTYACTSDRDCPEGRSCIGAAGAQYCNPN